MAALVLAAHSACALTQKSDIAARERAAMAETIKRQENEILLMKRRVVSLEKSVSLLKKKNFSLLLTGDILLDNRVIGPMKENGSDYPFQRVAPLLEEYDLVFANLETPITDNHDPADDKPYTFRLLPRYAQCLAGIRLDVVSLANNHILDQGIRGMTDTMAHLDDMSITYCGAGETIAGARRPALISFGGADVVILAYCERPPAEFYAAAEKPGTAPLDLAAVREDIQKYKKAHAIVLVSLHWGIEQRSTPRMYQKRLARAIIQAGADGIIGHHPHWPQGIELYRKKPIIYSLGNFVNGFYNDKEKDNIFVALHFAGQNLSEIEILPIAGKNSDIQFQPFLLQGAEAESHLKSVRYLCRLLKTRMDIINGRGYIRP